MANLIGHMCKGKQWTAKFLQSSDDYHLKNIVIADMRSPQKAENQ